MKLPDSHNNVSSCIRFSKPLINFTFSFFVPSVGLFCVKSVMFSRTKVIQFQPSSFGYCTVDLYG